MVDVKVLQMRKNIGIEGAPKYAYRRGQYCYFEASMGPKQPEYRPLNILQIENRSVFPIITNNERFGGLLLRNNNEQGRVVRVLNSPFDQSLEGYFKMHLPPAAVFYDLEKKGAGSDEVNRTIHLLRRTQTFNMPLLIHCQPDKMSLLEEYRFSDLWTEITVKGLDRKLAGLHRDWQYKLSMFDQFMNVAWGMVLLLRERDPYTAVHSVFVAMFAYLIGEKLGLTPLELEFLKIGGIYHDVGKIGIRDEVLRKPDKLNPDEFRHMRQHPVKGLRATAFLAKALEEWDGWAQSLQGVEREHHIRYDGKGYPATVKSSQEIALFSWIIGMADSLDAMTTMRSYVKGKPTLSEKIKDIEYNTGKQFHPRVANACLELLQEGIAVRSRLPLPSIKDL